MRLAKDVFMVGSGQLRISNRMDCHIYLIDGGEELALIDSGAGVDIEYLYDNIRQDGFDPAEIKLVLLTLSLIHI